MKYTFKKFWLIDFNYFKRLIFIVVFGAAISSCSSTHTMIDTASSGGVPMMFPISAEQADKILAMAMVGEFPGAAISKLEIPNKGYSAVIRFMFDSHQINAWMIPTKGRSSEGVINGYYFEVNDAGTMPLSGGQKSRKVYERLVRDASIVAMPLPQTR